MNLLVSLCAYCACFYLQLSLCNLHHNSIVVLFHSCLSISKISLCVTCSNNHIYVFKFIHLLHLLTSRFFEQNNIRWPLHSSLYIKSKGSLVGVFQRDLGPQSEADSAWMCQSHRCYTSIRSSHVLLYFFHSGCCFSAGSWWTACLLH